MSVSLIVSCSAMAFSTLLHVGHTWADVFEPHCANMTDSKLPVLQPETKDEDDEDQKRIKDQNRFLNKVYGDGDHVSINKPPSALLRSAEEHSTTI